MKWALILPLVIAVGGYCAEWIFRFPALSRGAAVTAGALVLGVVAELIAVPIATTKLIRHRELRSGLNLTLTLIPALLLVSALALSALALFSQ